MSYHGNWPSDPQSTASGHSLEVERRLVETDLNLRHFQEDQDGINERHDQRITSLERMFQVLLYAVGVLATSKGGDLADLILSILKRSP